MDFDSVVVGAGVVGLAIARELALTGRTVLVLERHSQIGQETSSRNSEVIHAGIYYPKGSLKARLCVSGRDLLYRFCASHNVQHKRLGKLIVAINDNQVAALEAIYAKAMANGVGDLRFIEAEELRREEPALRANKAIFSPSTGIINSHELMLAFQGDMENAGGMICLRSPVEKVEKVRDGFNVFVGGEEPASLNCREVINSAGLGAQSLSGKVEGLDPASIPRQYLSRGCYFSLSGKTPFRHLIYPIPNNEGLGVHLTLDLDGCARFGPDTEWVDTIDYRVDPKRAQSFYGAIREYYPDLEDERLVPAYAGIRPKISGPGELAADFDIQGPEVHGCGGYVALYGIESPGLTSSMAIALLVKEKLCA